MSQVDLNKPLLKAESGLLLDPSMISEKVKQAEKKAGDDILEKYNDRVKKAEEAPIPGIRVSYSYILTRAVPPKMKEMTAAGLILNQLDVDVRTLKKLKIMTENVSDEQEVLLVGHHVTPEIVKPGEVVKIDFRRYKTLNDDHTPGVIETSYEIPLYEINGYEYMLLDARDIIYAITNDK